jgi:hypothetical protein
MKTSPTYYSVNYWGSKPGENDDCHSGEDFPTLVDAESKYWDTIPNNIAWVELDGPGIHWERPNLDYKPTKDTDDWRREMQREDAMLHGVEGWNAWEGQ